MRICSVLDAAGTPRSRLFHPLQPLCGRSVKPVNSPCDRRLPISLSFFQNDRSEAERRTDAAAFINSALWAIYVLDRNANSSNTPEMIKREADAPLGKLSKVFLQNICFRTYFDDWVHRSSGT